MRIPAIKYSLILIILSGVCFSKQALSVQTDSVRASVTVQNGMYSKNLVFGLDPLGTDTIDTVLGEYELPPMPPAGVFEARFIGSNLNPPINVGQGLWRDVRYGYGTFVGTKKHELQFQRNINTNAITINWNFPQGISGKLSDLFGGVVVNDTMYGAGSVTIQNTAIEKLFMTIYYNNPGSGINTLSSTKPIEFRLYNNYPNPFNSYTRINFDIVKAGTVNMKLYDMHGREVINLFSGEMAPGSYTALHNLSRLTSGIYFVTLQADKKIKSIKIILIK